MDFDQTPQFFFAVPSVPGGYFLSAISGCPLPPGGRLEPKIKQPLQNNQSVTLPGGSDAPLAMIWSKPQGWGPKKKLFRGVDFRTNMRANTPTVYITHSFLYVLKLDLTKLLQLPQFCASVSQWVNQIHILFVIGLLIWQKLQIWALLHMLV